MKQVINLIKKYFIIWWIPIIFNLLAIGIFICGTILERDWIIDFSLFVFFTNIFSTIISSIVQVILRKWYFIFPQVGVAIFLFYYTSVIFMYSPPDYYGAHKEIPENIEISEPLDSLPTPKDFENHDLILTVYAQPGIYKYYTAVRPKEKGSFYLKAFEITTNDQLSKDRLKEKSKIRVDILDEGIFSNDFTIYEGSWGDKYGARIELWFKPDNGNKEYKLVDRNFIVEGWMR